MEAKTIDDRVMEYVREHPGTYVHDMAQDLNETLLDTARAANRLISSGKLLTGAFGLEPTS